MISISRAMNAVLMANQAMGSFSSSNFFADPPFLDGLDYQGQRGAHAEDDREPFEHRGAAGKVGQEAAAQGPQFGRERA